MVIALRTDAFGPDRLRTGFAAIALEHRPWMRQGMVDHGYVVEKKVGIVLVDVDAFLDDGLVVVVQRNAACIERPRAPKATCLDFQHVVFAVAVGIDPSPDRIADEGRHDLLRPVAAVSEDATRVVNVFDQNVRRRRRHHEFGRSIRVDDARHSGRCAGVGHADALAAGRLVREVGFEARLVFRREGRLLCRAPSLGGVESVEPAAQDARDIGIGAAAPLPLQIGVFGLVERLRSSDSHEHRGRQHGRTDRASVSHHVLPVYAAMLHCFTVARQRLAHSTLMPLARMGAAHFATSRLTNAARYSGVWRSGAIGAAPISFSRSCTAGRFSATAMACWSLWAISTGVPLGRNIANQI